MGCKLACSLRGAGSPFDEAFTVTLSPPLSFPASLASDPWHPLGPTHACLQAVALSCEVEQPPEGSTGGSLALPLPLSPALAHMPGNAVHASRVNSCMTCMCMTTQQLTAAGALSLSPSPCSCLNQPMGLLSGTTVLMHREMLMQGCGSMGAATDVSSCMACCTNESEPTIPHMSPDSHGHPTSAMPLSHGLPDWPSQLDLGTQADDGVHHNNSNSDTSNGVGRGRVLPRFTSLQGSSASAGGSSAGKAALACNSWSKDLAWLPDGGTAPVEVPPPNAFPHVSRATPGSR